jgi:hypothetical protein
MPYCILPVYIQLTAQADPNLPIPLFPAQTGDGARRVRAVAAAKFSRLRLLDVVDEDGGAAAVFVYRIHGG